MSKDSYQEYLKGYHWKSLRAEKRRRAAKTNGKVRCGICSDTKDIHTHHLCYKRLYDVTTSDLRLLCGRCHALAHKLIWAGIIDPSRSDSHHGRWSITKEGVKKALGLSGKNLFNLSKI